MRPNLSTGVWMAGGAVDAVRIVLRPGRRPGRNISPGQGARYHLV